jgi:eukaryotic-like serine/threonine-protein kinase
MQIPDPECACNAMDWNRLQDLFDRASELPEAERGAFAARECAGEPELEKALLDSLAESESGPSVFLGGIVQAATASADLIGKRFGPYLVEREIGRGGMGEVYLARRADEEFEKRIALKIVRRGVSESEMIARFRQERQILARLEHPNIVRLLDGGTTPEGIPYLAMDYVEGMPITEYCEKNALDVKARCRLMLPVCDAVAHAHRNLVIHRDLKPANILVTAEGSPRLLDFGIAKLIDTNGEDTTLRPLTPDYASPEQKSGAPITTATDVYQLGAILFRLVTGEKPGTGKGAKLPGELSFILSRAMHAESERRYASAQELAEDLRRYLENRPVLARPDSFVYQARKWVERSPLVAAALALALVAVLVAGGVAYVQGRRAERRFEQVRSLATTFVFDFDKRIRDLPGSLEARTFVVDKALANLDALSQEASGDARLMLELAGAYGTAAAIQGDPSIPNIGKTQAAIDSLTKSVSLAREGLRRRPADRNGLRTLTLSLTNLGMMQSLTRRNTKLAKEYLGEALETARKLEVNANLTTGELQVIGRAYLRHGDINYVAAPAVAKPSYLKTVEYCDRLEKIQADRANRLSRVAAVLGLSRIARDAGDVPESARLSRETRGLLETLVAENPKLPGPRRQLGIVLMELAGQTAAIHKFHLNRPAEALAYLERFRVLEEQSDAAERASDKLNADALNGQVSFLNVSTYVLVHTDKAAALREARKSLAIATEMMKLDPRNSRNIRQQQAQKTAVALMELRNGNAAAARDLLREVVRDYEADLRRHPDDLATLDAISQDEGRLALAHLALREFSEAEKLLAVALPRSEQTLAKYPDDLYFLRNRANLLEVNGDLATLRGDAAAARKSYGDARGFWEKWKQLAPANPYPEMFLKALSAKMARAGDPKIVDFVIER